jgi:simple sugar transport system substrate-binding protein/ribose transport system substrate-binding protein
MALVGGTLLTLASASAALAAGEGKIAVDIPRNDSDFWTTYAKYVPTFATELAIDLMTTNSQNDVQKLVANAQAVVSQGAKAIVMAPQDTGAIASTLDRLASQNVPVVTIDTRPDKGKVFMVVRADNIDMGQKACKAMGDLLGGKGKIIEIIGGLSNVNGRDRHEGFTQCLAANYPDIQIFPVPTEWDAARAASGVQTALTQNPDMAGIYTPAGGVFLSAVLQTLKTKDMLHPAGEAGHITIVSTDGVPEEFQGIRDGLVDATVSQPCDLYAKYGLLYAQAALQGKTFAVGPTDHGSNIVDIGNGNLEDQLPGPLVTKANVDDKSLWANQ